MKKLILIAFLLSGCGTATEVYQKADTAIDKANNKIVDGLELATMETRRQAEALYLSGLQDIIEIEARNERILNNILGGVPPVPLPETPPGDDSEE